MKLFVSDVSRVVHCVCVFVCVSSCQAFMCATAFETNAWARKLKTKVVFVGTSRCVVEHESNLYCIERQGIGQQTDKESARAA